MLRTINWIEDCQHVFTTLKHDLPQPPILSYPLFHLTAKQFMIYSDGSDFGLGAVLEQNNCVIAYASYTLSKSEQKLQHHPKRMSGDCICHQAI